MSLSDIPGLQPGETPVRWSADGSAIFVEGGSSFANIPHRHEIRATSVLEGVDAGRSRRNSRRLANSDAGRKNIRLQIHSELTDLYIIEGLK